MTEPNEPQEDLAGVSGPPSHPTKYPSADRAALLPSAGEEPRLSLEEAFDAVNRDQLRKDAAAAELERLEIVRRFPLDEWPSLPLDRYALGLPTSADGFCRWMEFTTAHLLSIKGGSALKHLIFRRQSGEWYFEKKYASVDEAWLSVRAGFVEAFRLAGEGRFDEVGQLDGINAAVALSTKAIYCYFPDEVLPIAAGAHQEHFWRLLGGQGSIHRGVSGARKLRELVRQLPLFDGWTAWEVMSFLYSWADPRGSQQIVKIAPGSDAHLWDDCLENGYIRVGWEGVGDLREFEGKDQFTATFADVYSNTYKGNGRKLTEKANEVWALIDLHPGDIVVANRGTSRVMGIGRVADKGYEFRPDLGEYGHTVSVSWDDPTVRDIDPIKRWAFKTVAQVSQTEYLQILKGKTNDGQDLKHKGPVLVSVDRTLREMASELDRKGQLILYGPPGTGKTYNARRFAVWWLSELMKPSSGVSALQDPATFRAAEESLSRAEADHRIWWVTANPSEWSWDRLFPDNRTDYRYGRLQRNYGQLQTGDLVIGYQANPTKRIMAIARIAETLHPTPNGPKIDLEPVHAVSNGPTWTELLEDKRLANSEPIRHRSQGTLFALTADEGAYLLAWLKERDASVPELLTPTDDQLVGPLTRVTFHPSYTYEDFVEGFKPQPTAGGGLELRLEDGVFKRVCAAARAEPTKPYLLLIDEINRGNIPKIFGELITLIERDKRELTVTLPQSRERFDVPKNVYIVGTMNTADRSIRLLDAALRRRFAFIELMPETALLEGAVVGGLDLGAFLGILNDRIANIEGREKQIGHSFLLDETGSPLSDIDQFAAQFRHEIVPLLQEYSFEDYRELETYLGSAVVDVDAQRIRPGVLEDSVALVDALAQSFKQALSTADAEPA